MEFIHGEWHGCVTHGALKANDEMKEGNFPSKELLAQSNLIVFKSNYIFYYFPWTSRILAGSNPVLLFCSHTSSLTAVLRS